MKVLELFSGSKSISKEFIKAGHETFTLDFIKDFEPDMVADILEVDAAMILERFGRPDVIWASPPCTTFSVASIGHHWKIVDGVRIPQTKQCFTGLAILNKTLSLIRELAPKVYFIENPRGMMRKMEAMQDFYRYTVTYCQYGDIRMKPTDIWSNRPFLTFKPPCSNGDKCHVAAPRGSQTGTQGIKGAYDRSRIPPDFCTSIVEMCEKELEHHV